MNTNSKFKKAITYKAIQERLRKKALKSGVNLIAPETVFLSKDTKFGKNVTINPYVVIGKKVRIGNNVEILSFSHIEGAKIENKVKNLDNENYFPMDYSKIFLSMSDFLNIKNKLAIKSVLNEKKTQKK